MPVLVACEESQAVTTSFREFGIECYSCDIQPCSGGHPEWHIQQDVIPLLDGDCSFTTSDGVSHVQRGGWNLIVAHPECRYLTVSGNRWFNVEKYGEAALERMERREEAASFFMTIANAKCERIAIENPVGIMSSRWRKPDQIIQPWQFGHGEVKQTCLWLKNLPPLVPTDIVEGREPRIWKMGPSAERSKLRSKTYPGIAQAMASQWGAYITTHSESKENQIEKVQSIL